MDFEYIIIGAGVVGLAIAAELSRAGEVLVLEKADKYGQGGSSRNSEVVHAGIYYPPGSLKAGLCVAGRRWIEQHAEEAGIGYAKVGKYIIAVKPQERNALQSLYQNAAANGVDDLRWVEQDELREVEPDVRAAAGLHSPSTGIIDSHRFMWYFKNKAESQGADFVFSSEVTQIHSITDGYEITVRDPEGNQSPVTASNVINSAGLYADHVARLAGMDVEKLGMNLLWAKGVYFSVAPEAGIHIRHLIYPVPDPTVKSLGIHSTVDLQGSVRFGPTVRYLKDKTESYNVENEPPDEPARGIARYLPSVRTEHLTPVMAGIRPKLQKPGEPQRDFLIREESENGLPRFVNLIGIESPGLTAAPAIAEYVRSLLENPKNN